MARAITGRITLNLVAGILLTVATVTFAVFWMAQRQNEQAQRATRAMVAGGIESLTVQMNNVIRDRRLREAVYDAYTRGEKAQLQGTIAGTAAETMNAELVAVVSPDGKLDYGWHPPGSAVTPEAAISPMVITAITRALAQRRLDNTVVQSGIVAAPGGAMALAFARLGPAPAMGVNSAGMPILVVGQSLSDAFLQKLGRSLLVNDLRFQPAGSAAVSLQPVDSTPVFDMSDARIGDLVWALPTPGYAVLREVALPLSIAVLLFFITAFASALSARSLAIALTKSEQIALAASRTDSLTGLMNRNGFSQILASDAFQEASAAGNLAMIYFDVNGFKAVNDSIGHHGGDELVKLLSQRLAATLPEGAPFARLGGDEFAVAMIGENVKEEVEARSAALVHSLDEPFMVHGFEFHVTAAIGYATANRRGVMPPEVLRRADLAMYQAKAAADREAVSYHPSMETGALEKKQIEKALRTAIEKDELTVLYQPIVRATDLSIVALEALVRWNSEEFGTISPALFVPVAEEAGLIHDVGRLVLRKVCADFWRWPDLKVTINISPVQLRDPNFATDVQALLARHGVAPSSFELELTEGILVNNPTIAKRKLAALKELGFSLSLDDFGTGFSSIGYLRQFPFDRLKLDRSFVREIGLNPTANALIQAVVSLGDAMDLAVVAEGIENAEQLTLLRLVQCEFIQGFFISPPIAPDKVSELLRAAGTDRRIRLRTPHRAPEMLASVAV